MVSPVADVFLVSIRERVEDGAVVGHGTYLQGQDVDQAAVEALNGPQDYIAERAASEDYRRVTLVRITASGSRDGET